MGILFFQFSHDLLQIQETSSSLIRKGYNSFKKACRYYTMMYTFDSINKKYVV